MTLFLIEVKRLLKNPFGWAAAAIALALQLSAVWGWAPDMSIEPIDLAGNGLLVAAAMLLGANLAASRDRRHGMPELLAALPGRAETRTRAVALAGIASGTLIASLLAAGYLAIRYAQGPVGGRLNLFEVLGGVAATALAAAFGVALARWLPSLIAAPAIVFGLALLVQLNRTHGGFGDWYLPLDLYHRADWPGRPSAPHLIYLLAGSALLSGLALLRHRVRPVRLVVTVLAFAIALPAAVITANRGAEVYRTTPDGNPLPTAVAQSARMRAKYYGPGSHRCQSRAAVRYCALPGYQPWIELWAAAVQPIASAVPPAVRGRIPVVTQLSDSWLQPDDLKDPASAVIGLAWDRAGSYRTVLAADVIRAVTGLASGCDGRGQARTVVALWLLGQLGPLTAPEPVSVRLAGDTMSGPVTTRGLVTPLGVLYGPSELSYARQLLANAGARERVWANWNALMTAPLDRALPLLGITHDARISTPQDKPCV